MPVPEYVFRSQTYETQQHLRMLRPVPPQVDDTDRKFLLISNSTEREPFFSWEQLLGELFFLWFEFPSYDE